MIHSDKYIISARNLLHNFSRMIVVQQIGANISAVLDRSLILFLLFVFMMGLAFVSNPLKRGLTGSYYDNTEWKGSPITIVREDSINLLRMQRVFPAIKTDYSIRWEGVIFIPVSGEYQFALVSDDGSSLFIDNQLVIDNGGFHVRQERTGKLHLEKGFHPININYMQGKGVAIFRAYWTRSGQGREDLSKASFFPEPPGRKAFLFGRLLEMLLTVGKILFLACAVSVALIGFSSGHISIPSLKNSSIIVLIFLLVFISHFFWSDITTAFDSKWSIHTTMSIIREGNTDLDEYITLVERYQDHTIERINNHFYTIYPIGTSLLAIPYVFLIDAFMASGLSIDFEQFMNKYSFIPAGIEKFVASNIIALSSVFIYLIGCLVFDEWKYSLLMTFIFAFCTSAWSSASRALWQHGPSMFLLTVSLYLLLLAKYKPKYEPWAIRLVSIPLVFSYVVRPTNGISILILTIFILIRYRKHFLSYCLWSMLVILPFLIFNFRVYHSPLSPYYFPKNQLSEFGPHLLEALVGTLFSPSRGVFIFSPILLFSIYGIILKIRHKQMDILDYSLAVIIVFHWLLSSSHPHWWGGHSYGPRYFSDIIPYFIYFLVPVFTNIPKFKGIKKFGVVFILICTLVMSFFIHYRGATSEEVYAWNAGPVNIDVDPSRAWDWHDIQFLRGL